MTSLLLQYVHFVIRSITQHLIIALILCDAVICQVNADQSLLVPAIIGGKQSTIYQKVIVASSRGQLRETPGGEGAFIEPFAIFYKLRTEAGELEKDGHIRVGDSQGSHLGWIAKGDVVEWNTRFVLEPLEPTPERKFIVQAGEDARAELQYVPAGKRRFAFITADPTANDKLQENAALPVVVCTAEVRADGGRSFTDELNDLSDMKLEVVFVLEATDFMLNKYGDRILRDYMVDLADGLTSAVKSDSEMSQKKGVRFGIIEYQDTSKLADYNARVRLPLTEDVEAFAKSLKDVDAKEIKGDWPEDVLAGLELALKQAGWQKNSVKHIIHIGQASMQLEPRGIGQNEFGGDWNDITAMRARTNPEADCGHNSTGLTIERLLQLSNPEGGTVDERARMQRSYHSLWIGKPIEVELREQITKDGGDPDKLFANIRQIVRSDNTKLMQVMENLPVDLVGLLFGFELARHQQALAQGQYKELTSNRGKPGYFRIVDPTPADVRQAASEIKEKIHETIAATAKIRRGEIQNASELDAADNPIAERFYVVVGAAAERFKDQPVITGTATVRDDRGRLVAQKKVLVTRDELVRLKSTFDALHKTFQKMTAKVDRQDVASILDTLKRAIASATAGQKVDADVPLKDLITDLPLRTDALEVTPGDVAVMSSDAFGQWLNKLESSLFRIQDLLDGKAQWMTLNEKAENDKFTFLHLTELP